MDETGLYVWGSYFMGLALVVSEIVLLLLRGRNIRGHLGWSRGHPRSPAAPRPGLYRRHRDRVA
jgi:heme exporter protein CcmD